MASGDMHIIINELVGDRINDQLYSSVYFIDANIQEIWLTELGDT